MAESKAYTRFAQAASKFCGKPKVFLLAVGLIIAWLLSGPIFHYSDTWQLIINTSTTIITFLMVFIIQNTQNRDTEAMELKLDELIRATEGAQNRLLDLEDTEEEFLDKCRAEFKALAKKARSEQEEH
jgi:low affinity Fe/Cu permease